LVSFLYYRNIWLLAALVMLLQAGWIYKISNNISVWNGCFCFFPVSGWLLLFLYPFVFRLWAGFFLSENGGF